MRGDDFFAAVDTDHIAGELFERVEQWQRLVRASSLFERMQKSYRTYYGLTKSGSHSTSKIRSAGERDELALFRINHYRSLLQHILVMTTQQRPAMECRASNTDRASQEQTILGNSILDYYVREKKLEQYLRDATEIALIYSEGYIGLEWDPFAGNIYAMDPETQRPIYEGDIRYKCYTPLDVVRDTNAKSSRDEKWRMLTSYENKYDLAAKYPQHADKILALDDDRQMLLRQSFLSQAGVESDLIPVYRFYYDRCEALPQGRRVEFLNDDIKLLDTPLPYKRVPICRIAPNEQVDTPFGYSVGFDLLGIQDAYDTLNSVVYTNQKTFGVQNILVPEGHNMNPVQLFGGLNLLKYNNKNGEIKPLQLTATAPEIFNYITSLRGEMEAISGVNSVSRGNPGDNIKSGSFAALVAAQAIQFNSGLQNSYNGLLEDVGLMTIEMLQTFANTKRVANLVGKNNESYTKEFNASDLQNITRVVVDAANPLLKTTEGKMEMANQLLNAGQIEDGDQYLMVATTGKLEPLYEGKQKQLVLIRAENEKLAEGPQVVMVPQQDGVPPKAQVQGIKATLVDKHALHIQEHACVLSDLVRRQDPAIVAAVTTHIQEHIDLLRNTDPGLLMVLKEQPLPPVQPPMMPGMPPQGAPAPQGQPVPAAPGLAAVPNAAAQNQPRMPSMPTNPMSGNKFNPITGGQ